MTGIVQCNCSEFKNVSELISQGQDSQCDCINTCKVQRSTKHYTWRM